MDGRHAALGTVAALAVVGVVRCCGSAVRIEWVVNERFDAGDHCELWFNMEEFVLADGFDWWDTDDLYGDQDYLDETTVERYVSKFRRGEPIIPIFVEEDGRIKDGHHRWEAAKRLGLEWVPVWLLEYDPWRNREQEQE